MRVLLDESLPRQLARHLGHHEVVTVHTQGWNGMTNGELLRLAEREGFDVMVTADQGIEFQQNLSNAGVGIVVVRTSSNRMEHLLPLAGQIVEANRRGFERDRGASRRLTAAAVAKRSPSGTS